MTDPPRAPGSQFTSHRSIDLITGFRFDVMAKVMYASHRKLDIRSDWAMRVYVEHLQVRDRHSTDRRIR